MRILAIDWGQRRMGLAGSSTEAKIVNPLPPLQNDEQLISNLIKLCQSERIDQLVVGLPRNLAGEETPQTKTVREFGHRLSKQIGLPVSFQDETLTTVTAIDHPQPHGTDSGAAAVILEDYLRV